MTEKSANGWTASKDPNEIHIKQFLVTGTNIKPYIKKIKLLSLLKAASRS